MDQKDDHFKQRGKHTKTADRQRIIAEGKKESLDSNSVTDGGALDLDY